MDNLIYITPDGLPKDVCSEIINRFERSDEKVKGMTTKGINEDMKKSTELFISPKEEWKDIDDIIYKSMSKHIDIYAENFKVDNKPFWCPNGQDEGYNIKRYEPGDYYHWHVDHLVRHDGKDGALGEGNRLKNQLAESRGVADARTGSERCSWWCPRSARTKCTLNCEKWRRTIDILT